MGGELDGRVAVITGAGRGIGRAFALELAREGATCVLASRTLAQLEAVAAECRVAGGSALAVAADAMDESAAAEPVRRAIAEFGRIDILINNVGGGAPIDTPADTDPYMEHGGKFEANIALNMTSPYWTTREALPHMQQAGFGRIVFIGSGYSKRSGGALAYTTAKHGLIGMTRALAGETAKQGDITVNCLCPGWTNTELIGPMYQERDPAKPPNPTFSQKAHDAVARENLQNRIL